MNEMLKVLEEMLSEASDVSKHFTDALGGEDSPTSPAVRLAYERKLAKVNRECTALTRVIAIIKAARGVVPVLENEYIRHSIAEEDLITSGLIDAVDTFRAAIKEV